MFSVPYEARGAMRSRQMLKKVPSYLFRRGQQSSLSKVTEVYTSGSREDLQCIIQSLAASRLPFEEYVRELAVLKLGDREYSTEDYAAALGRRINRHVEVSKLSKAEYTLGADSATDIDASFGRLVYLPGSHEIHVEVPVGLSPWLHQFTVGHELGHLAAAHPPPLFAAESGASPGSRDSDIELPSVQLARKPPLLEGDLPQEALMLLYDAEADLRSQYMIITGNLGPVVAQTSTLSQIS